VKPLGSFFFFFFFFFFFCITLDTGPLPTPWTTKVSGPRDLEGQVTKFAPDKALKLIAAEQVCGVQL
jgi:hypothetical protein